MVLTNLFPSNVAPGYAPFNRQQFAHLGRLADVTVYGIVPWRFGRFYAGGSSKNVVDEEYIDGLRVIHPRFVSIPGMPAFNAGFLASALLPKLQRVRRNFDVVLASYAYPDGCAGVLIGRGIRRPVVVKCHGSDLNRVPDDPPARMQIQQLLPRADAVVCVSRKLTERAVELGVSQDKLHVVYNGVDRERFALRDKLESRRKVGLPEGGEVIVYVGHLAEHKGTRDLLDAVPALVEKRPGVLVAFVGDGPMAKDVGHAAEHGARVLAVGRVSHEEVPDWMAAADVVTLPSWNEGMPNVVREAHAIGRPVVATDVGGIPEAICDPGLGRMVPVRQPKALAEALAAQLAGEALSPEAIRKLAVVPSWPESAQSLLDVLDRAAYRSRPL